MFWNVPFSGVGGETQLNLSYSVYVDLVILLENIAQKISHSPVNVYLDIAWQLIRISHLSLGVPQAVFYPAVRATANFGSFLSLKETLLSKCHIF